MRESDRLVRQAAEDARSQTGLRAGDFDDMIWDGDMLVPRASPLDRETLDERSTSRMGERWEEVRRDSDE